ncbi:MAG TPA: hypothetical protein VN317_06820 [Candidatus Methanoperedens sp.]|nr:hypothetical protein [Candidatus Methanoperedens sp.]
MTRVIADTHLHLYPSYDFPAAIAALAANLTGHGAGVCAGFLTERSGCNAFAAIGSGALTLPPGSGRFQELREPGTVALVRDDAPPVYLFAGRQIATAERIEVLALTFDTAIADGLPAAEVIAAVRAAGGVPVLAWSPGKWWFARGRLVRELLARRQPGEILVGDTALRPAGAREPRVMREARRRGIGVLAGSDALPLPGEERYLGSYVTVLDGDFDPESPRDSVRRLLRTAGATAGTSGARVPWTSAARRWLRNARAAGGPAACAG